MTPFAAYLLSTLSDLYRCSCAPVRTAVLADVLAVTPRTARRYLSTAESAGLVTRRSPKTGWLPSRALA